MEENKVTGFGRTKKGEEAHLYLLENKNGVKAYLTDYGAALVRLLVPDKNNELRDVVLGYDDTAGYEQGDVFFGATVGRNANRVGGAHVEIAGKVYKLEKNDNDNNLHSGTHYYNKRLWDVVEQADDHVAFVLHSPDGDQGYPGALDMHVTYTLDDDNTLTIHYEAVPDQDTVINMTNHSYFNLNGHDSGDVLNHTVCLKAGHFSPVADSKSIPTGEHAPVAGTPMDFTKEKTIGQEIGADFEQLKLTGGYDHNFIIDKTEDGQQLFAIVKGDQTGIVMEVFTTLPGMQLYCGNYIHPNVVGKGGFLYQPRYGVCFETQYYPNAINIPSFSQPVAKAGVEKKTTTIYRFFNA